MKEWEKLKYLNFSGCFESFGMHEFIRYARALKTCWQYISSHCGLYPQWFAGFVIFTHGRKTFTFFAFISMIEVHF